MGEIAPPDTPTAPEDGIDPAQWKRPVFWATWGRASRLEWWGIVLGCLGVLWLAVLVIPADDSDRTMPEISSISSLREAITSRTLEPLVLVAGWLVIAVTVRRLHDLNYRSWDLFIRWKPPFSREVPLLEVPFLVGTRGDNRFGPGRGASRS